VVNGNEIKLDAASQQEAEEDRTARANLKLLADYAARTDLTAPRRVRLRFLASPREILGEGGRITGLRVERNELVLDHNGGLRSQGTGRFETIDAGLVVRSIGYRTVPIEGVPFDPATSTISNIAGQVVRANTGNEVIGEYVVGWAKRGPTGLIGNNRTDSRATVEAMMAALPSLAGCRLDTGRDGVDKLLRERGIDWVTSEDWKLLDQHELEAGAAQGRPRVKVTSVPEMMDVIRRARVAGAA
jgi:ferredoxin--NADP+ reductase